MDIVGALDLHRKQITFKVVDMETGEVSRGRIMPAARGAVGEWLDQFKGRDTHIALEATTGWRFVVEEMERAGVIPHLAEPAETHTRRGRKRRAKTDNADCDLMTKLLCNKDLPESWIPPEHILEVRTLGRLRKALIDERREWQQRIQAQLYHQGVPPGIKLGTRAGRSRPAETELSPAGRQVIATGLRVLDYINEQIDPIDVELMPFARRQQGCRALQALFGVGWLTSVAILAELGDCRRFTSSDDAVRFAGLDITVCDSDGKRSPGHLSRQGPELLRWALYEAAQCAARKSSPDHAYYLDKKVNLNHKRACLSVARKLVRRAHHILREVGDDAFKPIAATPPAQTRRRALRAA